MPNRQMSTDKMHATPCIQNTEETIAKYAVDANLFRLGSTNPKKNIPPLDFFFQYLKKKLKRGASPLIKKIPGAGYFFKDWWTLVRTG